MWNSYLCTLTTNIYNFFFFLTFNGAIFSLFLSSTVHSFIDKWDTITVLKVKFWTKRFLSNLEKKLLTIFVSNLLFSVCYSTIKKNILNQCFVSPLWTLLSCGGCAFLHAFFFSIKKNPLSINTTTVYHYYYSISISDV